jgi:hypothetical protein
MSAVPEAACSRRGGVTEGDEVGPGHHGATLGDDVWPAWTPRPRARVRQREMLCSSCIAVFESPRWLPSSWRCRLAAVPCLLVAVMVPMGSWAKAMHVAVEDIGQETAASSPLRPSPWSHLLFPGLLIIMY